MTFWKVSDTRMNLSQKLEDCFALASLEDLTQDRGGYRRIF